MKLTCVGVKKCMKTPVKIIFIIAFSCIFYSLAASEVLCDKVFMACGILESEKIERSSLRVRFGSYSLTIGSVNGSYSIIVPLNSVNPNPFDYPNIAWEKASQWPQLVPDNEEDFYFSKAVIEKMQKVIVESGQQGNVVIEEAHGLNSIVGARRYLLIDGMSNRHDASILMCKLIKQVTAFHGQKHLNEVTFEITLKLTRQKESAQGQRMN